MPYVALAACLYLLAHGLRGFRYWLLYGDAHLSLSRTLRLFYVLTVVGLFVPLPLMEPCKVAALTGVGGDRTRTCLAYAVHRTFDLLGLGLLLLAAFSFSPQARPWVVQEVPWPAFLGLCALAALFLATLASARAALFPLQNYFLRRHHSGVGAALLRLLCRVSTASQALASNGGRFLLTPLLLTLLAWGLDVAALHFILPQAPIEALAPTWMGDSVTTLLSMRPASAGHRGTVAKLLFVPQAVLAAGTVLHFVFLARRLGDAAQARRHLRLLVCLVRRPKSRSSAT